jgi:hypothetical protein
MVAQELLMRAGVASEITIGSVLYRVGPGEGDVIGGQARAISARWTADSGTLA